MSLDVYEPLDQYEQRFKAEFARHSEAAWAALLAQSGVDAELNAELMRSIQHFERQKQQANNNLFLWQLFLTLLIAAALLLLLLSFAHHAAWLLLLLADLVFIIKYAYPGYRRVRGQISEIDKQIRQNIATAWKQMEPLNRLYDWDLTLKIIEQTVPRLQFDPYFNQARLLELTRHFQLEEQLPDDQSVLFAQSGQINGNPFVFGELQEMNWGSKTYVGQINISWRQRMRDKDGRFYYVSRTQTLSASCSKPVPLYERRHFLVYGNDAAPNLSFSRSPSKLSGKDKGFLQGLQRRHQLGKLKAFSRNLDDASEYTMMANEEFELLFNAKDRDHEVEFRLLFTALAQQQMLKLLQDRKVGYGDNFHFFKNRKINLLFPRHLQDFSLDSNPRKFHDYNLAKARQFFLRHNAEYFKVLYFALAPLLAIPVYQQVRSQGSIYGQEQAKRACAWECESLANYLGEDKFEHPFCISNSILKSRFVERQGALSIWELRALGYKGEKRVEYHSALGGDGRLHKIPVYWTEYLPVEKSSRLELSEQDASSIKDAYSAKPSWGAELPAWQNSNRSRAYRRKIVSFLQEKI
ncbi:MAG: hypothetical protein PHG44_05150 [Lentisphaeria bacterium]|nr:hypothetical protein [Lentisphaeria bacterium]NLZ59678.1 hypothetical protein [Lentisphaerota bacterium]